MATDYCTAADLERYFSKVGVDHFADHDDDGIQEPGVVADAIERATDEINLYVLTHGRYAIADLVGNRLLNSWCVVLATCDLCQTRGNGVPESVAMECQRIFELLEKVMDGKLNLPEVARQGQGVPTFSNLRLDRRYRDEKVRVIRSTSSKRSSTLERDWAYSGGFND